MITVIKFNVDSGLLARERPGPGDREKYVGASEIGICPRLVTHQRLTGHKLPPSALGKTIRGTILEPECISILEEVLSPQGWAIWGTGEKQYEYLSSNSALMSHPDFVSQKEGSEDLYVNDIKTVSFFTTKTLAKGQVPAYYLDQVQAQIGTAIDTRGECAGGNLWFFSAENLSECFCAFVPSDPTRYTLLQKRAASILEHVAQGRLPDGDASCGCCGFCELKDNCLWALNK